MIEGVRVLVVEDHAVVRSSLGLLLASYGATVVGEAADGETAVTLALELRPEIILMDITLAGLDGIEATRRITAAWPAARVLALTMHAEDVYLVQFLQAGGAGYVRKVSADRDVLQAIQAVLRGETFLGEAGVRTLLQQHPASGEADQPPGPQALSERERFVLEQTARGFTSREIGELLNISPNTVDTYRARLMEKLGLKHRHELVEYALRHRLLG
jgi:DNA-binding NarL/FixJ family response regulator